MSSNLAYRHHLFHSPERSYSSANATASSAARTENQHEELVDEVTTQWTGNKGKASNGIP